MGVSPITRTAQQCTSGQGFWKLVSALLLCGCGDVVLRTTDEAAANSNTTVVTDAGVVNDTFYIWGQSLMDPCGNPIVLRGVNEMPTFTYQSKDGSSYFGEITQTRANAIRLYWQTSDTPNDLDRLLVNAEAKRMIPVIYAFNDATTNPATSFSDAATFWTSANILPIVLTHRQWLIIALRERSASGASAVEANWASNVDAAVKQIRQAGINVPLAVDAPQFGTDTAALAASGGDRILADPRQNIVFSVNAWWPNASTDFIKSSIHLVTDAGLPTIIGEFSGYAQAAPDCLNITFDYSSVIQVADETHAGYFPWSWGAAPNTQCPTFNMTSNGMFSGLVADKWGKNVAVLDPVSIFNTSVAASFVPGAGCHK